MFFKLAEVLYVVQFTCSTDNDYSDAVQSAACSYMPAASREHPGMERVVSARRGRKQLQTRVSKAGIRQRRLHTTLGRVS